MRSIKLFAVLAFVLASLLASAQTVRDQIGRFDVAGYPGNTFPVVLTFPTGVPASLSAVTYYIGTTTPLPAGRQPSVAVSGNTATITFQFPRSAFEWQGYHEVSWGGRTQLAGDINAKLSNRSSSAPVTTLLVAPADKSTVSISLIGGAGGSAGVTAADIAAVGDSRYRRAGQVISYLSEITDKPFIPVVPDWIPAINPGYRNEGQVNALISSAIAGIQSTISQQATDILGRVPYSTYTANRIVDQNATAAAQSTANTALSNTQNNALLITGLQTGKVPVTRRIRFNGGAWQTFDNDLDITVSAGQAGVNTLNGRNGNLTGFVETADLAPYNSRLTAVENGKVNIVAGQGLSTNDFTNAQRDKLATIAAGATNVTDNAQLLNGAGYAKTADVNSWTAVVSARITAAQAAADAAQNTATNHANRSDNPHNVTAAQLGVYLKGETDQKLTALTKAQKTTDSTQNVNIAANQTAAANAQSTANTANTTANNNTAALAGKLGTTDRLLSYDNATNKLSISGPNGNSVTIPVGSSGSSSPSSGQVFYISAATKAAIEQAVSTVQSANAGTYSTIVLQPGTYNYDAVSTFTNLKNITIEGFGGVTLNNTVGGGVWQLQGTSSSSIRIQGITFSCSATGGGGNGLLSTNEQFGGTGLWITDCKFTSPKWLINGITMVAYSVIKDGGNGVGNYFTGVYVTRCRFVELGRIGGEFVCHTGNDNKQIYYLNTILFTDCYFRDLGRVKESYQQNGADVYNGMATSFSGYISDAHVLRCDALDAKLICYEFAGTRNFSCINSSTAYQKNQFTGISISNGYGNQARPSNGRIVNCTIRSMDKAIVGYTADTLLVSGGSYISEQLSEFNSTQVTLEDAEFWGRQYNGLAFTDGTNGVILRRLKVYNLKEANNGVPMYQAIWFGDNCKNADVQSCFLYMNSGNNSQPIGYSGSAVNIAYSNNKIIFL